MHYNQGIFYVKVEAAIHYIIFYEFQYSLYNVDHVWRINHLHRILQVSELNNNHNFEVCLHQFFELDKDKTEWTGKWLEGEITCLTPYLRNVYYIKWDSISLRTESKFSKTMQTASRSSSFDNSPNCEKSASSLSPSRSNSILEMRYDFHGDDNFE